MTLGSLKIFNEIFMRAVRQRKPEKLGTAGTGEKLTPIIKIHQHSNGRQWLLADHRR